MTPEPCAICGATEDVTRVQLDCCTWEPRCETCSRALHDLAQAWVWGLQKLAAEAAHAKEAA